MSVDARVRELFEPVLTLAELAEYLRVPVQTLYDLRVSGRGPRGLRVGRCLLFRQSEIEAWLASLEDQDGAQRQGQEPVVSGRPRTVIGSFGEIQVRRVGTSRYRASTRFRDLDGRLRRVTATGSSAKAAASLLKGRLVDRRGYGSGGMLSLASPFGDLVGLWLADLERRDLAVNTKENYGSAARIGDMLGHAA